MEDHKGTDLMLTLINIIKVLRQLFAYLKKSCISRLDLPFYGSILTASIKAANQFLSDTNFYRFFQMSLPG